MGSRIKKFATPAYGLAFVAKFFSSMVFSLLNVSLAAYAIAEFAVGSIEAGFVVGVFALGSLAVRPFAGRLTNAWGPGRLLVAACMAFLAWTVVCGLPCGFVTLTIARALQGVAFGLIHNTMTVIVATIVPEDRLGEGMGVFAISTTLSTAVGPALGITLQQNATPSVLFGVASVSAVVALGFSAALLHEAPCLKEHQHASQKTHAGVEIYFERAVVGLGVMSLFACAGYASVTTFLNGCLVERGFGYVAAWYLVAYPLVSIVLRPYLGRLIDMGCGRRVALTTFLCLAAGLSLLAFTMNLVVLAASAILVIVGYGGAFFCLQTLAVKCVEVGRVPVAAATFGVLSDIGLAVGPMVAGVLQAAWGYGGMYACFAFLLVVVVLVATRRLQR